MTQVLFKRWLNALWLLWHLCFQTSCAIRCFIVTPQMEKPRLTFDIYDYKHLIVQSGKWSHLLNFLKEVENTNSSSLSFIYSFFITIINVAPLMMMMMMITSNLMTCTPGYYANTFAPASTFGHPASTFGFFNQVTMIMGTCCMRDVHIRLFLQKWCYPAWETSEEWPSFCQWE